MEAAQTIGKIATARAIKADSQLPAQGHSIPHAVMKKQNLNVIQKQKKTNIAF